MQSSRAGPSTSWRRQTGVVSASGVRISSRGCPGCFSVQLGVRSSEAEAQAAYQQFQKKYADLGGAPSRWKKNGVNGP